MGCEVVWPRGCKTCVLSASVIKQLVLACRQIANLRTQNGPSGSASRAGTPTFYSLSSTIVNINDSAESNLPHSPLFFPACLRLHLVVEKKDKPQASGKGSQRLAT